MAKESGVFIKDVKVSKTLARYDRATSTAGLLATLTTIHGYLIAKENKMFSQKIDSQGVAWAKLLPVTKEIRVNLGFEPGPINQRTGMLKDYMTQGSPDILGRYDFMSLAFPTRRIPNAELVKRFNQSEGIKPNATPRSVIGVSSGDTAAILAIMNSSLVRAIG